MSTSDSNLAFIIPAPKAPLELKAVEKYTPGPGEVLVKNEVIAYHPGEWKTARLSLIPVPYPTVLGLTYGGTVVALGDEVTSLKVGDRIATSRRFDRKGDQYAAFQKYAVAAVDALTVVPEGVEVDLAASVLLNIRTAFGILGAAGKLGWPRFEEDVETKAKQGKKVLIYGGSSQLGVFAIQYAKQAGYTVITTSSPRNHGLVSSLGPDTIIDHTEAAEKIRSAMLASGPYELVLDAISEPTTINITSAVLSHQGGGTLWTVQYLSPDQVLPSNVKAVTERFGAMLDEPENQPLGKYLMEEYIPKGLLSGHLKTLPLLKILGGLNGINTALDTIQKGTSGVKLVGYPWEA